MTFQYLPLLCCCFLLVRSLYFSYNILNSFFFFALRTCLSVYRLNVWATSKKYNFVSRFCLFSFPPWSETAYSNSIRLNSTNCSKMVISLSVAEFAFASYPIRNCGDNLYFSPLSIFSSRLDNCKVVFRYVLILKNF